MNTIVYFEKSDGTTQVVSPTYPLPVVITSDSVAGFSVNVNSNNPTVPVRLVNGQSGKSIKITSLFISSAASSQVTLVDGDGTAVLGPIYLEASPHSSAVKLTVTAGKDLNFIASTAANVTVAVSGNII